MYSKLNKKNFRPHPSVFVFSPVYKLWFSFGQRHSFFALQSECSRNNETMDQFHNLSLIFVLFYSIISVFTTGIYSYDIIYTPMRTKFYTQESDLMLHLTMKNPCTLIPYMYGEKFDLRGAATILGNKCEEVFFHDAVKPLNEMCEKPHDENVLKNLTKPSRELVFKTDIVNEYGPEERWDKSEAANNKNFEMNVNYDADDNYRLAIWLKLKDLCDKGAGKKAIEKLKEVVDLWIGPNLTNFLLPQDVCPVKLLFTRLYEKQSLIKKIAKSWTKDSLDRGLVDLYAPLIPPSDKLNYDLYRPFKCYRSVFTASFHFQLKNKVIDTSTVVKRSDAFKMWSVLTPEGHCIREYVGPKYFIHNKTSSCWKPIDEQDFYDSEFTYLNTTCLESRKPETRWKVIKCVSPTESLWPLHQVKREGNDVILYCYPGYYFPTPDLAQECPPYPFFIKSGFSLETPRLPSTTSEKHQSGPPAGLGVVFWSLFMIVLIVLGLLLKDWGSEVYDIAVNSRIMRTMQPETAPSNVEEINITRIPQV